MPHVVAAFTVGDTCPPQSDLDELAEEVTGGLFSALPEGVRLRSVALCAIQASVGTNVVSIGIWIDQEDVSEEALREELAGTEIIVPGRSTALFVTIEFIKLIAEATWKETDKTIGRVTLGENIEVGMEADELVTKVVGRVRIPVLPDVSFTYTSRERFSLTVPGSEPPLQTSVRDDLDTGAVGLAFIVGLLSPILGVVVFFAADPIAESTVPNAQHIGEGLASAWPSQIMTRINPPFLPGKFVLIWTDLSVDERGILTLGAFLPATRVPRVTITGPRSAAIREALGHALARFSITGRDLRPPLNVQWGGAASGSDLPTTVMLVTPGTTRIQVNVRDVDALAASDEHTVAVSLIPLEDGQQPF